MNPTDKTLNVWKQWLEFSILRAGPSALTGIIIQLRDSELEKTYPGIYISEGSVERITAGGVMDGNAWKIMIETSFVTTPGEDSEDASSKVSHDALKDILDTHVNSAQAESYIDNLVGISCHQLYDSSPATSEKDGFRVTAWQNEAVICLD